LILLRSPQCVDDSFGDLSAPGEVGVLVGVAQLLGALPCDVDLEVLFPLGERVLESLLLPFCEFVASGAEDVADPVQRDRPSVPD
jgi:hypothetical protein